MSTFSFEDAKKHPAPVANVDSEQKQGFSFDEAKGEPPARGFGGLARDAAAVAAKAAIGIPESIVGLADIPTGGRVGKFLENEGGTFGVRFKEAKEIANSWHSDATKHAQAKFEAADGLWDKAGVALENPSLIATTLGESLPGWLGGSAAARGALAAAKGLGWMSKAARGAQATRQARIAGAIGEGTMMAGSQAEAIRQQTDDGLVTPGQAATALGTGFLGGAMGFGGAKLAQRLGVGEADSMLAQGMKGLAKEHADTATSQAAAPLTAHAAKSIPRQVIEGAMVEGLFEELPQSAMETVLQNLALDKPWSEGLDDAIVMGALTGGAMGAGAAGFHAYTAPSTPNHSEPNAAKEAADNTAKALQAAKAAALQRVHESWQQQADLLAQQEAGEPAVEQTTPPDGSAALAAQQARAATAQQAQQAARAAEIAASRAVLSPDDEIYESTGTSLQVVSPPTFSQLLDTDSIYSHWSNVQDGSDRAQMRKQMDYVASNYTGKVDAANMQEMRTELEQQFKWFRAASPEQKRAAMAMLMQGAPSVQMGLDPNAGGLTAVAALAVDSGASAAMQAQQAASAGLHPDDDPSVGIDVSLADATFAAQGDDYEVDYDQLSPVEKELYDWEMSQRDAPDEAFASLAALDDSDIPFFDQASNTSEADFLRALGATEQEITHALGASNSTRSAQSRAGSVATAQKNEPAGTRPGAAQSATARQSDSSPATRIKHLEAQIELAQAQLQDWSSRKYQPNRKALPEYEAQGGPADVSEANEQRRLKAMADAQGRIAAARAEIEEIIEQANASSAVAAKARKATTQGEPADGTQAPQAQQAAAQQPAARASTSQAIDRIPAGAAAQTAVAATGQGGVDGATATFNHGAQAGQTSQQGRQESISAIAQEGSERRATDKKRKLEASERWTRMTTMERQAAAHNAKGLNAIQRKNVHTKAWADLSEKVRGRLLEVVSPTLPRETKSDSDVEAAAAEAATSPTNDIPEPSDAQKEAGNYKKGHLRLHGLDIAIENPAGTRRNPAWPALKNHYGYIKGSVGADKDHVDVFLTDNAQDVSLPVFVVDQNNRDGSFDEHKVIMGAATVAQARATYLQNYEKGWTGLGGITQMTQDEFKAWVMDAQKTRKRVAPASSLKRVEEEEKTPVPQQFAGNKIFTADKVQAARERLRKKLGQLNSGIDPELLVDGMTIAGAYIESGVRSFSQFAKAMIDVMGDGVKPYLLSFWEGARNYPGLDTKGMSSLEESRQQFEALVTPVQAKAIAPEAVGEVADKPKNRSRKSGQARDRTLTQDWGVDHIDGYGDSARETGNRTKDAFLKEAQSYLKAVAEVLTEAGFTPHLDHKGNQEKPVAVNESGAAGSGEVSLTMMHPDASTNIYVHVGDSALRGVVPTTPSGIAVMARVSMTDADKYASKGTNQWMPVDLSAVDLAAALLQSARAIMEVQSRTNEPKENSNERPEQAGSAANQSRAPGISGGRGNATQPGSAPADTADLAAKQPQDGPAAAYTGRAGSDGLRVPAAHVEGAQPAAAKRGAVDGRTRTSRTRTPDAGARSADSVKDPDTVSPANTGAGNFHIDNPLEIVGGGQVTRFDKNKAAIDLLNTIREAGRTATAEEQRILAGYTGWGSFGQELFQGTWAKPMPKQGWEERDSWLRDHLGQDEWESAQRSIINAHYTDPPTVMAMWDMVKRMGFAGGRVLEPSMGIGNFFGMMPADLKTRSQLAGIELDGLTGSMAQLLYPNANIKVMGYQESKTPDNFYDLVIGNWPFENTVIADRRYNRYTPFLHDYFFLKAMDQVRPGGLVIGITSNGSMDKKATTIRAALSRKAELVSAIRLPSGAFQEYAGTKVVTDIVILKKREQPLPATPEDGWLNSVAYKTPTGPEVFINEYYVKNPGNVIGTTDWGHGTTRMQPGMIVHRPENMAERLREAVALVPEAVMTRVDRSKHLSYVTNHTADREGALTEQDGKLFVVRGEHLAPAQEVVKYEVKDPKKTAAREQQLRDLIGMRRLYAQLIEAERAGDAEKQRAALRHAYEAFEKGHGALGESWGLEYLSRIDDPFYPSLAALSVNGKPAAILAESTIRGVQKLVNPTPQDAFVLARNKSVQPTLEEIAELANKPEDEVKRALIASGALFELPTGDIVPSDIYLSGNVRHKLREAQAALADGNKAMDRNVSELKKVVPADIPYFNIESQLGATWVPAKAYADYIAHMLNRPSSDGIEVTFTNGRWKARLPDGANTLTEARTGFGTEHYKFSKLVNAALTNQTVKIKRKDSEGNEFVDFEATAEANARIADMRTKFAEWLWSDPERRSALEAEYNETRNAYANPKFDGSFLNFEGMALQFGDGPFNLRQHQANAIWRALVNKRSINAHEVGTGKTFTMGGIAVESRRYGIAKKPMILAHNANSATVAHEIQMMYPAAKVLYVDNLSPATIAVKMRQIANDDWDAVVFPHSLIDRLSFREETLMEMAKEDIRSLEEEAYAAAEEDGVELKAKMFDDEDELKKLRSVTAKELVKARNRIIETIKKQSMQSSREGAVPFEELGIDMVMVDEVHEFKKPPISTRMKMKGLNTQTSNRSIALQFITRYVRANNFGGNVHTFSGTPITNTMTEIFHQMRYVMEDEMKEAGVDSWDGWFGSFAKEVQDVELSAAGEYEPVTRLASFINVPELRRMIGQYMDVVFANDMPEMQPRKVNGKVLTDPDLSESERAELLNGRTEGAKDRPYKKVINVTCDLTSEQQSIFAKLQGYARRWRQMSAKERKEAMAKGAPESPIITEGMANKASFDVRLVNDEALAGQEGMTKDDPGSKVSKVIENVLEVYHSDTRAAQVIFSDMGYSTSQKRSTGRNDDGEKQYRTVKTFSTMRDLVERLVQSGIPREQIAVVDGSTSKEKRKEIAASVNALRIRVVIGSTDTLGVGVNMQKNLRAMHDMDAPYMPGELEQRNGRGLRQGNQWNTVLEYRYMSDRLDGRRWQILAIKQRFITAFMKASGDTRVIEGDAVNDADNDILQSFSEAAGDPRILIREKLRKNVESLQRAERMHTNGVADARRMLRSTRENIEWSRGQLLQMTDGNLPDRLRNLQLQQSEAFRMVVQGVTYDSRADAGDALDKFLTEEMRMERSNVPVGSYGDLKITARWPSLASKPELVIEVQGQEFAAGTLRGLEAQLRNYPQRIDKVKASIAQRETSIERLEQVAAAPFARVKDLEQAQHRLKELEKDIEINPVPPPAWLRTGAPVDSQAYRAGNEFVVTGHRWSSEGWFVLGQDAKGDMAVPYSEVTDSQGMPLYEEREFAAPEVVDRSIKPDVAHAPDTATVDETVSFSRSGRTTKDGLPANRVRQIAEAISKAWGNGPQVVIAQDMQDPAIPEVARRVDQQQRSGGASGNPEGFYYKGKAYLIASQLHTPNDVARVLLHEGLGHYGLRGVFGKDLSKILDQIVLMRKEQVRAKAVEYGLRGVDKLSARVAAEEVLAEMAQTTPELHFVQRAIAAIRTWLRRNVPGFQSIMLSDAEIIRDYILPARTWVERGNKVIESRQSDSQPALSRSSLDTFATEVLNELAAVDKLFVNPVAHAGTPQAAIGQLDPSVRFIGDVTAIDERQESGADTKLLFRTTKGSDFYVFEKGNEVWLDVSRLKEGEGGSAIYAALMDYAAGNELEFIGDPAGLSDIAMRRRLEAMLSSAIKHGSTDHIQPHARQVAGDERLGMPPLIWKQGDTIGNIQRMIDVSLASIAAHVPEFQRARYDFDSGIFRTGEGKPLSDGMLASWAEHPRMRAAGVGRRSIKRGILLNTLAHTESGQRPRLLEQALRQPRELVGAQAQGIFYKGTAAPTQPLGTRVDRAIMDMVREDRSAHDVLTLIAGTSRTPFNRKLAKLLLKTGINPKLTIGGDMGGANGFAHLAKYSRKLDEVTLTERAAVQAEQILLHELMHAATLKALDTKGLASMQMQRLYQHVKKQGGAAGQYGMKNVGEFVAEAFTNPEFQRALKGMSAPSQSTLSSAWDSFIRVLKRILGLTNNDTSALAQALELGVEVVREDMNLRRGKNQGMATTAVGGENMSRRPPSDTSGEPADGYVRLYHGGGEGVTEILDGGSFNRFDGLFASESRESAASHGTGHLYFMDVAEENILTQHALDNEIDHEKTMHALRQAMPWLQDDDVEIAYQAVVDDQSDRVDDDELMRVFREDDVGSASWEAQRIRGYLAKELGYQAVAMLDEHGISYLVLPGVTVNPLNETSSSDTPDDAFFGAADLRAIKSKGVEYAHNLLTHPGKVSLWDKTVGTMRHLAERQPAFKPVFEAAQQFIDDVSTVANEAANEAPRLIPRVDSLRDMLGKERKKPISVADNRAIGKALFAGTLDWGRDQHGKAMSMEALRNKYKGLTAEQKAEVLMAAGKVQPNVMAMWRGQKLDQFETLINNKFESAILKTGTRFNHQELKDFFGLNDQQVSLYDEARATVDKSLDITARAEMLRILGREWDGMREIVMDAPTLTEAWKLLDDELELRAKEYPDTRDRISAQMHQLRAVVDKAQSLMESGYMPLQRFGKYTVDVVDAKGEHIYFGMFESMAESNRMARMLQGEYPGAKVRQGTINDQQFKLFAGITPETAELFGSMLGLDAEGNQAKDQAFQEYLKLAKNNHSALKRLIHRKGIAGYSEDVGRVLASFVYSNARAAATGLNAGKMEEAINTLNTEHKDQGELGEIAAKLRSYIQDPQEEGQAIRGMLFAQYLGGSLASAAVNMTQPFAVTLPWLSQYGGMRKASAYMTKALHDMAKRGHKYEADLAHALKMAEDDGVVSPQEIHQLMAQARGAGGLRTGDGTKMGNARAQASNALEKAKVAWGQPFALAEQFNRRSTFIAAYRLAKDRAMDNPAEFARKAVVETQFLYTRANKAQWARGAIGGTLFTFKTYSVSYLELMQRMWTQGGPEGKRAVAWAAVMLLLMGGAGGLPFVEDAEDLIDGMGQMMGYNLSSKQWRKELMQSVLGSELAEFMETGLSGLPGAPIDVSGRLGMGNLIPGTGLFKSKQSNTRDVVEMVGPAGDLVSRGFSGAKSIVSGVLNADAASVGRGAMEMMPTAVRNVAKGADMAASGSYKDAKGYKVVDTSLDEALWKAIGFQPRGVAQVQESNSHMMLQKSFYIQTSNDIRAQWAQALFNKDDAAVKRVRDRLAKWNENNPEQPIRIKMPDIWKRVAQMGKDRTARIADTAPTAIRQQLRSMAQEESR